MFTENISCVAWSFVYNETHLRRSVLSKQTRPDVPKRKQLGFNWDSGQANQVRECWPNMRGFLHESGYFPSSNTRPVHFSLTFQFEMCLHQSFLYARALSVHVYHRYMASYQTDIRIVQNKQKKQTDFPSNVKRCATGSCIPITLPSDATEAAAVGDLT